MARSKHSTVNLSAADRWERRAERKPKHKAGRRVTTRHAVIAAAIKEA